MGELVIDLTAGVDLEWRVTFDTKMGTIPGHGPEWRAGTFTCKSEDHAHRYAATVAADRRWYRNVTIECRAVAPWRAAALTVTADHGREG